MGSRVQEYRNNLAQCEMRAAKATNPEVQDVYRRMTRIWLELVNRAEWLEAHEKAVVQDVRAGGAAGSIGLPN